tara:strand:+ start:89 stop:1168 length:1080 start_codon:yes stop_codon:yes gene_type:complete
MATTFKTLRNDDVVSTRSLLHEAIPITGSIVSGTYGDENIKNYSHGMFQSVYDYPYLSSSANHIFDLTVGYSPDSALSSSNSIQNSKKINIYNQMAQVLMGFDATGSIQLFDEDGDLSAGGAKLRECIFVNFSRLLQKDEIKKGSFTLELGVNEVYGLPFNSRIQLKDTNAETAFRVNSPAGEYGIIYGTNSQGSELLTADNPAETVKAGLLFYQAGVAILTGSVFGTLLSSSVQFNSSSAPLSGKVIDLVLTGSEISGACDNFRHRMYDLSFNNTTELNSTIYFCRANSNDFNYSSNPTYLSASKLRVKNNVSDPPVAFATTVGLYSPDNELLAVAKVSEPIQKDPTSELTLRVRLDY